MPHIGSFPVSGFPKPLAVNPSSFRPADSVYDFLIDSSQVRNKTSLTAAGYYAPISLPNGAVVTRLTLYGLRYDAAASMMLRLERRDHEGTYLNMAQVTADWTGGHGSGYDDTINNPIIDNEQYSYALTLELDPNAFATDVELNSAVIDWS